MNVTFGVWGDYFSAACSALSPNADATTAEEVGMVLVLSAVLVMLLVVAVVLYIIFRYDIDKIVAKQDKTRSLIRSIHIQDYSQRLKES